MRTPPKGKNEESTAAGPTEICGNAAQTSDGGKIGQEKSSETTNIFSKLGMKIKELESMMSGQRHINQAMRDLVSGISCLYDKTEKSENPAKRVMIGKASQVSPIHKDRNTPKRLRQISCYLHPTKKPKNADDKA